MYAKIAFKLKMNDCYYEVTEKIACCLNPISLMHIDLYNI